MSIIMKYFMKNGLMVHFINYFGVLLKKKGTVVKKAPSRNRAGA